MKLVAILILLGFDVYFINHENKFPGNKKTVTVGQFKQKTLFHFVLFVLLAILITDLSFKPKDLIIYVGIVALFVIERLIDWFQFNQRSHGT